MTKNTIPRQVYTVTAKNDCEVTASKNGTSYILITLKAGDQGTFVAISDAVKCSDPEAIILPFVNASIALGAGDGGISEEELIEKGVIDEWNQVSYNLVSQMGSASGFGSSTPTFKTCGNFTLTSPLTKTFNCIKFYCVCDDVPIVKINGQSGIYMNHEVAGSYVFISYRFNTPISFSPSMAFNIQGCTLGGGDSNNSMFSVQGLESGFYPYFGFYNYQEETLTGIENNVYKAASVDGDGHVTNLATNADVLGMLNYLGKLLDAEYIWGSLSPSDTAPRLLGFTFTTNKNNKQERLEYYNEIASNYKYISGGSHLKLIKLR